MRRRFKAQFCRGQLAPGIWQLFFCLQVLNYFASVIFLRWHLDIEKWSTLCKIKEKNWSVSTKMTKHLRGLSSLSQGKQTDRQTDWQRVRQTDRPMHESIYTLSKRTIFTLTRDAEQKRTEISPKHTYAHTNACIVKQTYARTYTHSAITHTQAHKHTRIHKHTRTRAYTSATGHRTQNINILQIP